MPRWFQRQIKLLSHVQPFATPWTVAYLAPPSMGFSRQEYWSGVPLPSDGKKSACNTGNPGWILGSGRSPGEGNATPPVFLPGESHGWRSQVGYSPRGRKELDTTERLHFHFSLSCIGEGNGNPLQCSCQENPRDGGA